MAESASVHRLERMADNWRSKKQEERKAMQQLGNAIRDYIRDGGSEMDAARVAGVTRTTVRRALGKTK